VTVLAVTVVMKIQTMVVHRSQKALLAYQLS